MEIKNEFLLELGLTARRGRDSYWADNDFSIRISGPASAGLWFKTCGCSYDKRGGCIMCDYSDGPLVSHDEMLNAIKLGLMSLHKEYEFLLVSPSGSMLDNKEVPTNSLKEILKLLKESGHSFLGFETRAETVTENSIKLCTDILGERLKRIYIGLESSNPWLLKYCINKELKIEDFEKANRILQLNNIITAANILIDIPFLTNKERIHYTVKSVKWALEQGVLECYLFPVHIKEFTPLNCFYDNGSTVLGSIWNIVEILKELGPEICENNIKLSWFESYGAYNVKASPTTCPECASKVIELLNTFCNSPSYDIVRKLDDIECECRRYFRQGLKEDFSDPIECRVEQAYRTIYKQRLENKFASERFEDIISNMKNEAKQYLDTFFL